MHGPVSGLILAAGFGSRLGYDMPKCLIPWPAKSTQTILDHQLERLHQAGIKDVWIVVGFQQERVRAHVGKRPGIHFVENPNFMDTNTAKSMLLGLEAMPPGGVATLNGDVVFDDGIIQALLAGTSSAIAVDPRVCGDEEIKYRVRDGRLQELNKRTHGEGEAVGVNFFAAADRPLLQRALAYAELQAYFERGVESILPFTKELVRVVPIGEMRAVEIDFPEDLETARRRFAA